MKHLINKKLAVYTIYPLCLLGLKNYTKRLAFWAEMYGVTLNVKLMLVNP